MRPKGKGLFLHPGGRRGFGVQKGRFCSPEGPRRGFGVQGGLFCSPRCWRKGLGVQGGPFCSPRCWRKGFGVQGGSFCSPEGPRRGCRGARGGVLLPGNGIWRLTGGRRSRGVTCHQRQGKQSRRQGPGAPSPRKRKMITIIQSRYSSGCRWRRKFRCLKTATPDCPW